MNDSNNKLFIMNAMAFSSILTDNAYYFRNSEEISVGVGVRIWVHKQERISLF